MTNLAAALAALARDATSLPALLASADADTARVLHRHAHRVERGGAAGLAAGLLEDAAGGTVIDAGALEPARGLLRDRGLSVRAVASAVPRAQVCAFEVGAPALSLSLHVDGRLVVGRRQDAGVAIDVATRARTELGTRGYQKRSSLRAIDAGRHVALAECEIVFVDDAGRDVETRKSGFAKAYTELQLVRVRPDRGALAIGCPDGVVRVHDIAKGKNANLKGLDKRMIQRLAWNAAGDRVVANASGGPVLVFPVGAAKGAKPVALAEGGRGQYGSGGCFLGDAVLIDLLPASFGVFDATTGALIRELPRATSANVIVPLDDETVACGGLDGDVAVIDVKDGRVLGRVSAFGAFVNDIVALDADRFAVAGEDGMVRVFSRALLDVEAPHAGGVSARVATSRDGSVCVAEQSAAAAVVSTSERTPIAPGVRIECVAVSEDGVVAWAEDRARVAVADRGDVQRARTVVETNGNVQALAFSPDGERIAVIQDRRVGVFDVASGAGAWTEVFWNNPTSVVFHPSAPVVVGVARTGDWKAVAIDGSGVVAEGRSDGRGDYPKLHPDGERFFGRHADPVGGVAANAIAFVVAHRRGGAATTIPPGLVPYQPVPEELATGARAHEAHRGAIADVAFLAKKRLVVTAGTDGTVRLWRESGELVHRYDADGPLAAVACGDDVIVALLRNGGVVWLDVR